MKKLFLIIALVLCYPCGKALWARFFIHAPDLTLSSTAVLVGDAKADHALYKSQSETIIKGTVIDYAFNSFGTGGDFLSTFGGRAILSSMQTPTYDHMLEDQKASGACMASYLNRSEQDGLLSHTLLIPASPEVLSDMRSVQLAEGKHFYMHGRPLTLMEASINGNSMNAIHGISYFLVDSFAKD